MLLLALTGCSDDGTTNGGSGPDPNDAGTAGDAENPMDAGGGGSGDGSIVVNRPELVPATDDRIATLRVPPGFRVTVAARDLVNPRMLAAGLDGSLYVTSPAKGEVLRLVDSNHDGDMSDVGEQSVVAGLADDPDFAGVHGIAIVDTTVYLASVKAVYSATIVDGGFVGLRKLVGDLPDGGQHPNRTLAVGPDQKLYVSVGSDCNACPESNTEHAAMLRLELDGQSATNPFPAWHPVLAHNSTASVSPRVFISGLRNTLGFDWNPTTGEMWGSDHGSDGLGNDIPPDELNRLVGGESYGWPYCWGEGEVDHVIDPPSKTLSKEAYCAETATATLGYQAHSAPIAFLFYRAEQFPDDYHGDAFVAFRGSWNRATPTGFKVVRVHFQNGEPTPPAGATDAVEDFLTGFLLDNEHQFGRIAGLAVDREGSLFVSEDANGVIYRVSYEGLR